MKKIILALALCALLLVGCALAEEGAPYVPGQTANCLVGDALDAGKVLTWDMNLHIDADPAAFGASGNNAQLATGVLKLLDQAHLRMGLGKVDGGLRLILGAQLDPPEGGAGAPASVDAAVNIDWDGVSVESALIPGQRFTAKWESLLKLGGADEQTLAIYDALKSADWDAVSQQMGDQMGQLSEQLLAVVAPYQEILAQGLENAIAETAVNVPAQGDAPAMATRTTLVFSGSDLSKLLTDLANQLDGDETLKGLLASATQAIESIGATVETEGSLSEVLREAAAGIAPDIEITLVFGQREDGVPVYIAFDAAQAGAKVAGGAVTIASSEENVTVGAHIASADESAIVFDYAMDADITEDAIIGKACDAELTMSATANGQSLYDVAYTITTKGGIREGMPSLAVDVSENMSLIDKNGTPARAVIAASGLANLTADGGEAENVGGQYDLYVGDNALSMTFAAKDAVAPDGNGGAQGETSVSLEMPGTGIDAFALNVQMESLDYDPASTAALSEVALETATQEELQALVQTVTNNGMMQGFSAMGLLPQELNAYIAAAMSGGAAE